MVEMENADNILVGNREGKKGLEVLGIVRTVLN
jgi:hypothetical protein